MVICLKIKTLDSQTYEFSVDDEVSVREFKETIAEKTNISADLQRLIYCGRVLVDEKKLKEYDVHGKVVHVVERPPPASRLTTQTNDASNRRQREGNDGNVRASPIFRALDGMVLGAMTIPVNASGSGQGAATAVPHLNPSSSFCMNRITVARHMLECANNIAAYLENPERGLNNASLDILTQGRWTMESTVVEVGISAAGNVDIPQNQTQNIAEALHGAVSAALRQNGHPNVTVVQLPTVLGPNGSATVSSHSQPRAIQFNPSELAAAMRDQREPTNNQGESSATNSTSDTASANTNETPSQDTEERERPAENNAQWHRTGTVVLGQVVQQMQSVQRRLDPFIEQYLNILMNDPSFEENDTAGRENAQRVYDRVSEALHYMSHAQHAISDLMLDLSQNSPRYLCCRPILVEQGGFVSSNNYLASFLNPNGNNNESTTANNNSASNNQSSNANPAATQNFAQTSPPTASATENASGPSATSTPSPPNQTSTNARDLHRIISPFLIPVPNRPPPTSTANQNANAENGNQANPQIPVARLIQAVLDSASFDTDLHVQINGLGFGYPQNASGQQQQPQSQNAATTTQNNTTSTNNASNTESASTNTTESAQPRVTTATLPTTSTQTRSTARPQVHVANIPSSQMWNARVIPANILSSFDRFLPCSSHHIRDNEMGDISQPGVNPFVRPRGTRFRQRRQPQESSTPTNAATSRVPVTPPESSTQSSSSPEPNFESINTPINLFGSIFTLGDLLDIRPSPVTFNRIRNDLHTFIVENLFSGAQINDENMQQAINQVIERLHDALVFLPQFDLPDYDSRASVENLLRASLPFVINLINEDESDEFGIRLLRQCMTFIHRLFVILITCVGRENAELYLNQIAFMVINSNNELEQDTSRALQRHLMAAIRELDLNRLNSSDVQQYLVLRRPAPPTSMCTDSSNFLAESTSTTPSVCAMNIPTAPPRTHADNEPLPTVDVGSEQWHSNFPTSWLPLITRDIERQRRMSPQRPFSDAYISGMSAKRRKLIQSTKTNGGFPTLIADGVRHAIQATGSATSNNSIDDVATSIANDTSVQLSYREAFSTSIQERLRADPDFNPLRFPNTTKFFDK